ncbi:MAG: hypothetical protein IJD94_06980 [Clostridia bacterium]|nr:hypothetical protein [Clostridia bacterium]
MKKMMMVLISLLCLVTIAGSALASGPDLYFTQRPFHGGQTLPVYYGPGHEYGRGANGWAKASTDEALYAAGVENGWALVLYETSNGSVRVGYVDMDQFHYNTRTLKLDPLYFEYSRARITEDCTLTDDPVLNNRDLAYLTEGTSVTYLASFYKYRNWAYIETWVDGHPIRAFVPEDCLSIQ